MHQTSRETYLVSRRRVEVAFLLRGTLPMPLRLWDAHSPNGWAFCKAGGTRQAMMDPEVEMDSRRLRLLALAGLALAVFFAGCGRKDASTSALPVSTTQSTAPSSRGAIPEPPSWSFPDIVESARAISPRNVEGRTFNQFGLAYPSEDLEAVPVATMSAHELQKYADIVTHAYPDAVFRQAPASCKEISVEGLNTTAVAAIAYVSLHAIEPATRGRATICLGEVQSKLKERKSGQ